MNGRQNNFDFLRLLAAFFVILTHSYSLLDLGPDLLQRLIGIPFSTLGLWIFFTTSGYLVTASACKQSNWRYWYKRALRILPAFYVCIMLMIIMGALITGTPLIKYFLNDHAWTYLKNLTIFNLQYELPGVFLNNSFARAVNGSIWTIPYEVLLYALPPLFLLTVRFLKIILPALIIALLLTTGIWAPLLTSRSFLGLNLYMFASLGWYFFAGLLLYLYKDKINVDNEIAGWSLLSWIILKFSTLASAIAVPILIIWIAHKSIKGRFIQLPVDLSYGLYLYAFPVSQLLIASSIPLTPVKLLTFTLIFTIPFALLSWFFVEKPFLKLKYARRNVRG
jgi:peptidoglycan/LPS O-acetylase OafA/YrhL